MQITEEDLLGDLLCWVRPVRHMLLMKLSLIEEVVEANGGTWGQRDKEKMEHHYLEVYNIFLLYKEDAISIPMQQGMDNIIHYHSLVLNVQHLL